MWCIGTESKAMQNGSPSIQRMVQIPEGLANFDSLMGEILHRDIFLRGASLSLNLSAGVPGWEL